MTRRIVYGISFWVFLGAAACTIAAIAVPNWVTYTSPSDHDTVQVSYGLFSRYDSVTDRSTPFPNEQDCKLSNNLVFCGLWRTAGFLMNFTLVIELACVVAYITVLVGGRGAREIGWKVVAPLLAIVSAAQLISMALVAYLYDNDERFFLGWELDRGWVLCTVSWTVLFFNAVGLLAAAYTLPYEDDYEPIS